MSKIVKYNIPCPRCKRLTEQEIYHTINNLLTEDAVTKILNDKINFVVCKNCQNKFQVKTSLIFVNHVKQYCFHYNPNPNNEYNKVEIIDNLKRMFGNNSYLVNPVEFTDWENFKKTIDKIEFPDKEKKKDKFWKPLVSSSSGRSYRKSWSCSICDGDETTGCLMSDPQNCPRFG